MIERDCIHWKQSCSATQAPVIEAVRVLGNIRDPRSAVIAMRTLDLPTDEFLDYAVWLTVRELRDEWLPAVQSGQLNFDGNVGHLTFALKSVESPAVTSR